MALPGSKVSHIGQVVNPEGYAYNEVGLLQKLEEILLPADYPWVESLSVTVRDTQPQRGHSFYSHVTMFTMFVVCAHVHLSGRGRGASRIGR
jgi:hypothetical protein